MKLLIVDDNAETRKLIRSVVRPLHAVIYESSNGTEAVESYDVNKPDVVLMDIEMKGMDGIAATKKICASDPEAHIIVVTTYDERRLRSAAKQAGAAGYLLKEDLTELPSLLVSK